MTKTDRRFHRQFEALSRLFPPLRNTLKTLRAHHWRILRLPLSVVLIIGGLLSFLPFLGIWMLPVGLLLLAVDLPFLRAPTSALVIRARRWIAVWMRRVRARWQGH